MIEVSGNHEELYDYDDKNTNAWPWVRIDDRDIAEMCHKMLSPEDQAKYKYYRTVELNSGGYRIDFQPKNRKPTDLTTDEDDDD